jgi:hypothetical protein
VAKLLTKDEALGSRSTWQSCQTCAEDIIITKVHPP